MTKQQSPEAYDNVRIPAELTAKLDHFFAGLRRNILKRAVQQAAMRASTDGSCVVKSDDLGRSAEIVLTEAMGWLNEEFLQVESQHVHRAS